MSAGESVKYTPQSSTPRVLESDNVVCYDVDDTLIIWKKASECLFPYQLNLLYHHHEQHILELRASKARGHFVIVWSQGGYAWAKKIVEELELTEHVDLIMCKPKWMCDDVMPNDWTKVFYKPFKE